MGQATDKLTDDEILMELFGSQEAAHRFAEEADKQFLFETLLELAIDKAMAETIRRLTEAR